MTIIIKEYNKRNIFLLYFFMQKTPSGLERMLKLQRKPKWLRIPWDVRQETSRLVYEAFENNKDPVQKFTTRESKLNREEEIKKYLRESKEISWLSCDELLEYIAVILGKDIQDVNINWYYTWEEYKNTELAFIFIFFAKSLGFSTEDMKKWRLLPMSTRVIENTKRYTQTWLHITQNHPALLELWEKIWIDFKATFNRGHNDWSLDSNVIRNKFITIKKWKTLDETFENICSKLDIDVEVVFCKNSLGKSSKIQREMVRKFCYILGIIYQERWAKLKIADTISNKIWWNKLTILGQYINAEIKRLEVRIEN